MVFAINKIDKPGANPDRVREELAAMNLLVEEWGGKYQCQEISAKKGLGVSDLLEKVLLEADMLDLKANPNRKATGSIIESSLDKGRGYVSMFDTGHVTIGLALVVRKTVEHLRENPDITVEELLEWSQAYAKRVRMGFLPGDLGYLRAGGRLSNAAFVGATLLRIKPIVELLDGRLVATKKLRGKMASCSLDFMEHMIAGVPADTSTLFFVRSCGLPLAIQQAAEQRAREMGFEELRWYDTQNVITSHCGPGSFAVAFPGIRK